MAAPDNPRGAKSDKIWRGAVMRAVRRLGGDELPQNPTEAQRLDLLADALVAKGITGDVPAIREIGDRLDGRPHQTADIAHIRSRAADLSDDELAAIVAGGAPLTDEVLEAAANGVPHGGD